MAKITKVTVHITASNPNATVEDIRRMHKARGFSDIGYHWLIDRNGNVHAGRPENKTGAHVSGHNTGNIGIAYISRGADNEPNSAYGKFMTKAQRISLEKKVADILFRYDLSTNDIYGHNDFNQGKACPCFKVRKSKIFLANVQRLLDELKGNTEAQEVKPFAAEMAEAVDGIDAEADGEPMSAINESGGENNV